MTIHFLPKDSKPTCIRPNWIRRWVALADADYREGARRDEFHWRRYREPYWARPALDGEYDGARRALGLAVTQHRRALVIVSCEYGKLWRFFMPVTSGRRELPDLAEYLGASHWWQIASDAFECHSDLIMRDTQAIEADA